jgi:hypothetical protein
MPTELKVPNYLWQARGAAITGFLTGSPNTEAEMALEDWVLSAEAYSERLEGDDAFGVLCYLRYDDCEIRARLELSDTHPVGDVERIKFARDEICYTRENGTDATHIDARLLSDALGGQVILGLSSDMLGQGGMDFKWIGLFESTDALVKTMLEKGYAVISFLPGAKGFDDYSDQELLSIMKVSSLNEETELVRNK